MRTVNRVGALRAMSDRMALMLPILLTLLLIGAGVGCSPEDHRVERTLGRHRAEILNQLDTHILSVRRIGRRVEVVTDGTFGIFDSTNAWQSEFTLGIGENFRSQPDHHIASTFELKHVGPSSLSLRYLNTIDRRSFGENLVSVDEGEVELPIVNGN